MKPDERGLEEAIEASLLDQGGYLKSVPSNFNPDLGLDTAELFAFIGATQIKEWERLLGLYGTIPTQRNVGSPEDWLRNWTLGARWTFCATALWT